MKTRLMIVTLVSLCLGFVTNANAQEKKEANMQCPRMSVEGMDSLKCQHMVGDLMLNDATTAKFESLYMNYLSELRAIYAPAKDKKEMKKDFKMTTQTDADVQKMIEDRFAKDQKILDVKEKYYKEFKKILSPKQVAKIFMDAPGPDMMGRGFGPMQDRPMAQFDGHKQKGANWQGPKKQGAPQQKENVTK